MITFVQDQIVVLTRATSNKEKEILGKPLRVLRKASAGWHFVCQCDGIPGAWWLDPNYLKPMSENVTSIAPEPETFSEMCVVELQTMDEWQLDQWSRCH